MDVPLADDDTVSRESHALVTYDAKHNNFSLSPGQGRGITYCNDEQVEMVRPLFCLRHHRGGQEPADFPAALRRKVPVERGVTDGEGAFLAQPAAV